MKIAHASEGDGAGLSNLVTVVRDVVRRRWLTLALVSLAVFALGLGLIFMMTPHYAATTSVRIDPSRNPLAANQPDAAALSPEAIETEVSVINSLDLARRVVRSEKLTNDPEFAKKLPDEAVARTMSPADRETAIAGAVLQGLSVGRDKLTYILNLTFTSQDSLKSAKLANAFAETYIDSKVGSKVGTAERQSEFFKQRLSALGAEVESADSRVAQYRAQAGIAGGSASQGGTIADQQVAPLSMQLATAQSDAAAARANLAAAQRQIASGGLDAVSEVLDSPVIADLRRQRAGVLNVMGDVQSRYGDKHPESIKVRDQLASIDRQIKEEAQRVVNSLQSTASAAEARAASLQGGMSRLAGERSVNTRNSVLADSLERQAAAKRAAYERLSQMSLESTQEAQNQIAQAEIVNRAQPPSRPSSPNKPLLIALLIFVAGAAGGGTIAVQEMLVAGLRSAEEVESLLGIPLLASIPKVPRTNNPADLLLEKPTSMFAESLRIARASILGVRSTRKVQVIAITSALPSEGKTTTALAFARTLAGNDAKTLLLECDVRRAAMTPLVKVPSTGPGTVEVLHGEATADEAITPGDVPNLDHLLVRAPYFSSGDLFGAGSMERLLDEMKQRYDLIVLDLPPLVGLADGRFLAVMADTTVLIVKWDITPVAAVQSALSSLRADDANIAGVVYTMVDPGAEAMGGLYYSKKYSSYYQSA